MEANCAFEGAVRLEFGPPVALSLVHLVVAGPGERDGVGIAAAEDLSGDAAEGELAGAAILEGDVGGFHHVGIVVDIVRHLDDSPAAQEARQQLGQADQVVGRQV